MSDLNQLVEFVVDELEVHTTAFTKSDGYSEGLNFGTVVTLNRILKRAHAIRTESSKAIDAINESYDMRERLSKLSEACSALVTEDLAVEETSSLAEHIRNLLNEFGELATDGEATS